MSFWHPRPSGLDDNRFTLKVTQAACIGHPDFQFLMGGIAMAAAIDAAERATEKPLLWATMQFHAPGALGDDVEISVSRLSGGRNTAQVGVSVSSGDRELQYMSAALGGRNGFVDRQFVRMPDVPSPEDCAPKIDLQFENVENAASQIERRLAFEDRERGLEHQDRLD